ncbi:MAG: hypothetical protein AAGB48_03520 [Planctomycetota bacterium]
MSSKSIRSAFVLGPAAAATVVLTAGLASGLAPTAHTEDTRDQRVAVHVGVDTALRQAADLLTRGRLVEAGAALDLLGQTESLSADQTERLVELVSSLERRLKTADPVELSLQKAEMALSLGELAQMRRHISSASARGTLSATQERLVESMHAQAESVRSSVQAFAADFEAQAADDFQAGRFARAKSTLMILTRAGVELSPESDAVRRSIFEMELDRGAPFQSAVAAGLFQPGVLERLNGDEDDLPAIALFGDVRFDDAIPADAAQPGVIRRDNGQPDGEGAPAGDGQPEPDPDDILERSLRAGAQSKLAQANRAYADAEFGTAIRLYTELLDQSRDYLSAEQITEAEDRLLDSQIAIDQPDGDALLGDTAAQLAAQRDRTRAEFSNLIQSAEESLRQEDTQTARGIVANARLTLNSSRNVFTPSEYEALYDETVDLEERISREEIRIQEAEAIRQTERLQQQQSERETQAGRDRQARINEQLDRARALQQEMKYEEALQVLDQVLFLDPNNPAALLMKDIIYDIALVRNYNDIIERRGKAFGNLAIDNAEASVPVTDLISYPDDWPRISLQRGEPVSIATSAENRRVLADLETQRLPNVQFDNPLGDVVGFLETVTQQNFDVDWQSLELLSIDEQTPVQLRLNNVSVKTVLDRLVEKVSDPLAPAGWAINDGIVQIASDEVLRRNTALVIYDIRDLLIEVPDYEDAPEIDLQSVLQSSQGGGGGQSPFDDAGGDDDEERDRQQRIDQVIDIIQNNVDFEGWQANGGDTGFIQELNGNLIIRNTPKNHREIQGLLSQLREQRAMQINVETRFLLVNQDFFEEIGFDIDVYFGANNNQVEFARGNDPTIQASDFFSFNPDAQSPDSSQGLQRSVTGAANPAVVGGGAPLAQGVVNPDEFSPIGVGSNSLGLAEGLAIGDFATSILGAAPALGVAGQFLNDIQVDFLVKATQADRRSVQLTAPRLTFTNGQIANIVVATQTAFVSQLTPVVATSAVGFDPEISVVSEGVTLEVEGTVSADRRYVTMNISTGLSRIDGFAQQPVTAVAGGQLVSSEDVQSFIQLPTVTVTQVQTTVTVPDQGTVLLGGQRLITEFEIETGVPVVSKIPVVNRFFTNRVESKEEQTLLVLLKPTILIQSEEEERNFPGLDDTIRNSFGG